MDYYGGHGPLRTYLDDRIAGFPSWYMAHEGHTLMFIPSEIRKSVIFVGFSRGGDRHLGGSASLLWLRSKDCKRGAIYAVTARHCIESLNGKAFFQINDVNGGIRDVEFDPSQFTFHDDAGVDAAVMRFPREPWMDVLSFPIALLDSGPDSRVVALGEEVFAVGLLKFNKNSARNSPIVRAGHIAAIPDEKIKWGNGNREMDAYLIECRSIGGLSGSPVFVYDGLAKIEHRLQRRLSEARPNPRRYGFDLLGLIHGHWNVDGQHIDTAMDAATGEYLNAGIAIVVPAARILEILKYETLAREREMALSDQSRDELTVMDIDSPDDDDPILIAKRVFDQSVGKFEGSS